MNINSKTIDFSKNQMMPKNLESDGNYDFLPQMSDRIG